MQEIILILSGVLGAVSIIAYKQSVRARADPAGARSDTQMRSEISALNIEKGILTKAISRLYHQNLDLSDDQKEVLLARYQRQLGIVLEKIDKASKHPDLGPLGDGLITMIDQRLSTFDHRLHEISSKITSMGTTTPESKPSKPLQEKPRPSTPATLPHRDGDHEREGAEREKPRPSTPATLPHRDGDHEREGAEREKPRPSTPAALPVAKTGPINPKSEWSVKPTDPIEITTLTKLPSSMHGTNRPTPPQVDTRGRTDTTPAKPAIDPSSAKAEGSRKPAQGMDLPNLEEIDEDEDDNLESINKEVMDILSRIRQAEIE